MSATEVTTEGDGGSSKGSLRIFLNYRREDSSGHAGRLYDDLAEYFSEYEIFIDIDKIEPGLDFGESIDRALDRCDVVLALIGKQWLTLADAKGRRRLDNPDDYVRLELEAALARGTRLIPVRVQGTEMPSSEDLPDSLRALARRHAVELSDTRWRHDVESLAAVLERLANESADRERLAQEEAERERLAREAAERLRLVQEETERERAARERAEREEAEDVRLAQEEADRSRLAQEEAERERLAREEAERSRLAREAAERERAAREEAEREDAKRVRIAREDAERERLARGQVERERVARVAMPVVQGEEVGTIAGAPSGFDGGDEITTVTTKRTGDEGGFSLTHIAGWSRRPITLALGAVVLGLSGVLAFALFRDGSGTSAMTDPQHPLNAPMSVSPVSISGTARAGKTLTARRGTWEHSPTKFTYQWRRCNAGGGTCVGVRGATLPKYLLTNRDVGSRIRVSITASNAEGSRTGTSEATGVVATALKPPSNSAPPSVSGTAQEGQRLIVRKGTWRGAEPNSYTYVWQRCNASGDACDAIGGARGTSYALRSQDVDHTIRVEERTSNAAGRRAARSKATPTVRAVPTSTGSTTTQPPPSEPTPTQTIETVPDPLPP